MFIQTKYLGEVEINREKIIQFPSGLPGFGDELEFVLLHLPNNQVFQILQSTTTANVAFIVTNPYLIYGTYEFELDDNMLETLQIKDEKDVTVFSIVTLKDPFATSTLNLKAPIIINTTNKLGKQYILNTDIYQSKASITNNDAADESRVR
ncbi:flagellar assembly protein FliW [Oceanobacillus sp. 143]|uniref:Flagellar assembly factor FliW n=1 Tax=Oceanobacillus zhaokaii TaxID=2052660 RepID=A0A345PJ36_9BACI|nr:flagellar assembly protein FliW [Oceanobacillus zhaokaii]AXI10016.1 flagellar assembly protein FliW [Oceanobacillus zhaokaii]QGS69177.1 flagellar assembly protein FliW [Oceanobacillus sp. 143]